MNSETFCQLLSQTKGHNVKLQMQQKQQKLLSVASLKLLKILDKLMVIKEDEKTDDVRMTWMKGYVTETTAVLSRQAKGFLSQTRIDDTMS